jgi:Fe2+ or Zn2+ uptake regulation protein
MMDMQLTDLLRDRGQRVTSQRVLIHRFLRAHEGHVTAEQVLAGVSDALPGTALPTVYATLELFEELGLVRRVQTGGGTMVFDPRTDPHHHLTCRRGGAVEDVEAPVERSDHDRDWITDTVLTVADGILGQGFEPTPSWAACSMCDYRIACPAAER